MSTSSDTEQTGKCPACKLDNVKLKEVNGILICEKCSSKRFSSKVRKSIQEAFERQELKRQADAWKKRIDIAKRGVRHFEDGKFPEALKLFKEYLAILENRHGVVQGGLSPVLFDAKKDAGEILLISGIYWDMAKIYDRMKGHSADLRVCLNKFIEFSLERPHIILASEAIRKYIGSGSAVNVQDFKHAHQLVVKNLARCFIASAVYGPTSKEVQTLRMFRDHYLKRRPLGRRLVAIYYTYGPSLAKLALSFPIIATLSRLGLKPFVQIISRHSKIKSDLN